MTIPNLAEGRYPALRRMAVLVPVALALFVGSISSSAIPIAAPKIAQEFDAFALIPWFVSSFLLASTIAAPIFGKLGDLHGRKAVSLVALLIFGITSLLAGLTTNMEIMIGVRVLQGLGAGGLMVSSMAMIADVVAPEDRAKVHGAFSWVFAAATICGPILGGLAVDTLSWRWVFFLNVPAAVAVAIGIIFALPPSPRSTSKSFDLRGAALLSVMLAGIVGATGFGTATSEALRQTGMSLLIAVLAAMAFARSQKTAIEPILPLSLFRIPEYAALSAFMTILGAVMFVEITYLPLFLQEAMGLTATESGAHLLPLLIGVLASSTLAGQFASRTGNAKLPLVLGCGLMCISMMAISLLDQNSSLTTFHLFTAGLGVGMGPAMSLTIPVIQNVAPPSDVGAATASAGMFRNIGGSIGIMIFGSGFTSQMGAGGHTADAFSNANSAVFFAGATVCAVGLAILVNLKSRLSQVG